MTNLTQIAEIIRQVPEVESVAVWEKYGKARVYVELPKLNGGKHWNGGKAGTVYWEDGNLVVKGDWAGARTRSHALPILEAIKSALSKAN